MITARLLSENPRGPFVLETHGLAELGRPELALGRLPELAGTPRTYLSRLLVRLAGEAVRRNLGPHAVVSLGHYGKLRLEPGIDGDGDEVIWLIDAEPNALNANSFLSRFMALTAFRQMDMGDPSAAVDCFCVALAVEPRNAALLQARAWARYAILTGDGSSPGAPVLSLQVFGDLLQSINTDPERPEPYTDLLSMLRAFRASDGTGSVALGPWMSEIVRMAFYKPVAGGEALAARESLKQFIENICTRTSG
ncbi:MAG: hypothetical protein ACM3JD_10850 [Rudaea sp.]